MTLRWTGWDAATWKTASPYVDWFYELSLPGFSPQRAQSRSAMCFSTAAAEEGAPFSDFLCATKHGVARPKSSTRAARSHRPNLPNLDEEFGAISHPRVPIPQGADNPEFASYYNQHGNWAPDEADLPEVGADTIVAGVIDTGIALGNNRFRNKDGSTRILAAWQQTAMRLDAQKQRYLPFGTELYRHQIDSLLVQHSLGGLAGNLAEAEFNSAAGLVNMVNVHGPRELAGRFAHGTIVADLVAGAAPGSEEGRPGIIAVNLPDRRTIDSSGIFLDYFAIYAVKRIADLADLIFQKSRKAAIGRGESDRWPASGFPIVINMSFGKNAGAKDGSDFFSAAIREMNAERSSRGYLPVQMVIPVGNHNLDQSYAELQLANGASDEIVFVTPPEDHTSNYIEIWTDRIDNPDRKNPAEIAIPLEIEVLAPNGRVQGALAGAHRHARQIPGVAKLYCYIRPNWGAAPSYKACYLLCTAPTLRHDAPDTATAPSGRWIVKLINRSAGALRVFASVQTDQSILPHSGTGRRARIVHRDYQRFDAPSGRLRDSYPYPSRAPIPNLDAGSPVRRHGSINATALASETFAIAGFRLSDGRPADYSATGHGYDLDPLDGRRAPTVSFPTDDSICHAGVFGAGAANGSVVAMRGTSLASAFAARWVLQGLLAGSIKAPDLLSGLTAAAKATEAKSPYRSDTPPMPKIGHGRIGMRNVRRVPPTSKPP